MTSRNIAGRTVLTSGMEALGWLITVDTMGPYYRVGRNDVNHSRIA